MVTPSQQPHSDDPAERSLEENSQDNQARDEEHPCPVPPDQAVHAPITLRGGQSHETNQIGSESKTRGAQTTINSSKLKSGDAYFGDYQLLEEIARGGMGVVYKARQTKLNRVVAVKMILSGRLASETDVRRFLIEAESAANLDHPGIVPVYEYGEHDETHYFSMAYVDGPSLADVSKQKPMDPARAASILRKLAEAIAFAHRQGVIHRDLKPANILIADGDQPRITDFGLAKLIDEDDQLTLSGTIMGSVFYMAPEQAAGRTAEIGPGADIYSLGAIFYELLTGRPAFLASTTMGVLNQVIHQEPVPPRRSNAQIPPDLETICLKCLEKSISKRFPTADDLVAELQRFERGEPILSRPIGRAEYAWRWCRKNPTTTFLTAGLALVLLVGVVTATTLFNRAEAEHQRFQRQQKTVDVLSNLVLTKTMDQTEDWLSLFFEPVERELIVMRDRVRNGAISAEQPTLANRQLIPLIKHYPQLSSLMIADDRGREYMLLNMAQTSAEKQSTEWLLRRMQIDQWEQQADIYEWSGESAPLQPTSSKNLDYDPRETVWFRGAIEKLEQANHQTSERETIHWTEPYVFFVTKDLGITGSISFQRPETPDVTTIVAFDVLLMDITRFTINERPTTHGKILILTENGKLVGLPADPNIDSIDEWKSLFLKPMEDFHQPAVRAAAEEFQFSRQAKAQIQSFETEGEVWWGAAKQFELGEGLIFWMLILIPESDLYERIEH
ncbi:MAG: serine/threonine protein kinase [Planctomycetaceae bacterium]|nr:serine/threonine protein kinase [Planctomycetaceae bacterium]